MKQEKNTFSKDYVQLLKKYGMLSTSIGEAHKIIKDSFRDIPHDVLEAELDGHLGYTKF